jgi:hypothetical protein
VKFVRFLLFAFALMFIASSDWSQAAVIPIHAHNPVPFDAAFGLMAAGSPRTQIARLNHTSPLPASELAQLHEGVLELILPVNGLAGIEIPTQQFPQMEKAS